MTVLPAIMVLAGCALLGVQLRPYWAAKYHGHAAALPGAFLILAPLAATDLEQAHLDHAHLFHANLEHAHLYDADLQHADLTEANLAYADLVWADLQFARLTGANLAHADLSLASLDHADLACADLVHTDLRANLRWANLTGANLREAHLALDARGANLTRADLHNATIGYHTNLQGANLCDADMTCKAGMLENLTTANLIGARYDAHTRWPSGFDPRKHDAIFVDRSGKG